jgi:uncharacterized RDD family membrane protein YckC
MIDRAPTDPALLDTGGVLERRLIAWLLDLVGIAIVVAVLHFVLAIVGLLTFGLGWLLLALLPLVPFAYAFGFLASRYAATPGQMLMGLTVVEHASGRRPTPLEAFVSTAMFCFSFTFAPLFLVALVTPRHRTLHDLVSGLLVVRAAPLTARVGVWNMPGGRTV